MLLTADIGNTNIVLALLDHGDRVVSQRRIPSGEVLPLAAYEDAVRQVLAGHDAPEGAVIGSVVPRLTAETADAIRRVTGLEAFIVGPTTPAGLDIAIEQPETLGVDLLAADAAPTAAAKTVSSAAPAQAVAALVSLGYSASDAAAAVARVDETLSVQEIITIALRSLSRV